MRSAMVAVHARKRFPPCHIASHIMHAEKKFKFQKRSYNLSIALRTIQMKGFDTCRHRRMCLSSRENVLTVIRYLPKIVSFSRPGDTRSVMTKTNIPIHCVCSARQRVLLVTGDTAPDWSLTSLSPWLCDAGSWHGLQVGLSVPH